METRAPRIPGFLSDRMRSVAIGTAFAVLAVILVVVYVKNYRNDVNAKGDVVPVLIATKAIPAATPGSEIAGSVAVRKVLRTDLAAGAVANLSAVRGSFVTQPIYRGDQLTMNRFQPLEKQGIKGQIEGRLRIIQASGSDSQLLTGVLKAGDHVDVVASFKLSNSDTPLSRIILRNLTALTTPTRPSSGGLVTNSGNASVLLRMTDAQAEKFFYVEQNWGWSFLLRPRVAVAKDGSSALQSAASLAKGPRG